jgi:hypothetical protein
MNVKLKSIFATIINIMNQPVNSLEFIDVTTSVKTYKVEAIRTIVNSFIIS